jgi:hypothetical protein
MVISKQIRDFSELFLYILNPDRGLQCFYAFLGVKYRDDVIIISGLIHCWHTPRWTIADRRWVIGLERY